MTTATSTASGSASSGSLVVDRVDGVDELDPLQVTVAHEFFHAVQFAYDAFEDAWFMEGTASWMEDEVYTDVNDNLQYLADSPLRHPEEPLDFGTQNYLGWYGSWVFFRFLEEYIADQPDPSIVRAAWEAADGSPGLHLGTSVRNRRALAFYRHLGYAELGSNGLSVDFGRRLA